MFIPWSATVRRNLHGPFHGNKGPGDKSLTATVFPVTSVTAGYHEVKVNSTLLRV
jgi:hypothetical protein